MSKIDLSIPALGNKFIDLRDLMPGDSYNWSWVRPLSQVNYLAIHHSAGLDTQTPAEIADYHISSNGWGGIGYHFLIAKNGDVFYVGDIGTSRANVANLNEQVIGICLIGNFISGRIPSDEQFDSTQKLADFFINNYSELSSVTSWDSVLGHKELPGQSTNCPGDNWPAWRSNIIEDPLVPQDLEDKKKADFLADQVQSLQASLASLNQQVISLQERVQEKDQEITELKNKLQATTPLPSNGIPRVDSSLTIVGALINLYKFIFPPRKEALI